MLYSAVGHAGASGYIAIMSLVGLAPEVVRPTALALNILVAGIAAWQFRRAGHFSWDLFWPFGVAAVPAAFLGGYLALPAAGFRFAVGLVLLYSAARLLFEVTVDRPVFGPPLPAALAWGGSIGLLSGLTGTGGGIFLTPLLLFKGWARPASAAGVSALFILLNSTAGLAGNLASTRELPAYFLPLLAAAAAGGLLGSHLGSNRLASAVLRRLLAAVLIIAGAKLLLT